MPDFALFSCYSDEGLLCSQRPCNYLLRPADAVLSCTLGFAPDAEQQVLHALTRVCEYQRPALLIIADPGNWPTLWLLDGTIVSVVRLPVAQDNTALACVVQLRTSPSGEIALRYACNWQTMRPADEDHWRQCPDANDAACRGARGLSGR